jgi:hypothetical protein
MPVFKYQSRGSANDEWNKDTITAESEAEALTKLDEIYGIERDEDGKQTNPDAVQVQLIK